MCCSPWAASAAQIPTAPSSARVLFGVLQGIFQILMAETCGIGMSWMIYFKGQGLQDKKISLRESIRTEPRESHSGLFPGADSSSLISPIPVIPASCKREINRWESFSTKMQIGCKNVCKNLNTRGERASWDEYFDKEKGKKEGEVK